MSNLEVPTLEALLAATPQSIRREADRSPGEKTGAERRVHQRLSGDDVRWLRKVRLKNGPEVSLVDISEAGALIETLVPIKPGGTVTLELSGNGRVVEVPSEVLRCGVATLDGAAAVYRGACVFTGAQPLDAIRRSSSGVTSEPVTGAGAAWQKIVVRYREGETLKGYTLDFHPSRGHLSLWPSVKASASDRIIVPLTRLKALFFVKDFAGNSKYVAPDSFGNTAAGRRIEVTFFDREVVRGTTLNYRPEGIGFFVTPADERGNNQRVFVITGAIRHVRFP